MKANARMTDDERRKVFWLLKKYSSYTAWEALATAYYRFADAYMLAFKLRTPDPNEPDRASIDEWMAGHLKSILDGRIGFEKGLMRLSAGDRSVWRINSRGVLSQAADAVIFSHQIMNPEEYVFDWMKNKSEVVALEQATDTRVGGLYSVCELSRDDLPAYWMSDTIFRPLFGPFNFPATLQEVPDATAIVVDTGTEVLVDGIYEPEWGEIESPAGSGLLGKIKLALVGKPSLIEPAAEVIGPRREHIGCMNYLLANTLAPTYRDGELDKPMPVTWHLVWKDERYLDGSIPPEEAEYIAPVATPGADTTQLRCDAGQRCPREGWWFSPAKSDSRRHFAQDEVMPAFSTNYGATIWQWDTQQ